MSLQGLPYGFLPGTAKTVGPARVRTRTAQTRSGFSGSRLCSSKNSLPLKPILTQVVVHSPCLRVSVVKMLSGSEHFTSKESITRWQETRAKATRDNVPIRSQSLALSADSTHNPASVYKGGAKLQISTLNGPLAGRRGATLKPGSLSRRPGNGLAHSQRAACYCTVTAICCVFTPP